MKRKPEQENPARVIEKLFQEWLEDGPPEEVCAGCPEECHKWEKFLDGKCPEFNQEVTVRLMDEIG